MFGAGLSGGAQLCPILSHPDPLVGPALAAHAPTYIGGIGAVLEVVPPGCRQGGISSAVDHSSSVLVNPHTWSRISPSS
jgi:hypothetical protein